MKFRDVVKQTIKTSLDDEVINTHPDTAQRAEQMTSSLERVFTNYGWNETLDTLTTEPKSQTANVGGQYGEGNLGGNQPPVR